MFKVALPPLGMTVRAIGQPISSSWTNKTFIPKRDLNGTF